MRESLARSLRSAAVVAPRSLDTIAIDSDEIILGRPQLSPMPGIEVRGRLGESSAQASDEESSTVQREAAIPQVHMMPNLTWRPPYRFELLQEWNGSVLRLENDRVIVRLLSQGSVQSANPSDEEYAELPLDDISEEDRRLVVPGAVFGWYIGYQTDRDTSVRRRVSEIRFRRLPALTQRDLEAAQRAADDLRRDLGWD